jgi:hypothetical protein
MITANFYCHQNFRQAVQVGTVFEIGVRFPATTQHPVLFDHLGSFQQSY